MYKTKFYYFTKLSEDKLLIGPFLFIIINELSLLMNVYTLRVAQKIFVIPSSFLKKPSSYLIL